MVSSVAPFPAIAATTADPVIAAISSDTLSTPKNYRAKSNSLLEIYIDDFYFVGVFFGVFFSRIVGIDECLIIYGKAVATTFLVDIFEDFNSLLANLLNYSKASTEAYSVSRSSSVM